MEEIRQEEKENDHMEEALTEEALKMTTFGSIPASTALAEASPESLREVFEKDPYKLTPELLAKQVELLRAHRERIAKGEASAKPSRQKAATKKLDAPKAASEASADELGF